MIINLTLPSPPSVNTYWQSGRGGHKFLSKKARQFKDDVAAILTANKLCNTNLENELKVSFFYYPPDLRTRDIDNYFKGVFDSLRDAKLYKDDVQIMVLYAEKKEKVKGGKVELVIETLN